MEEHLKIINLFNFKKNPNLNEARMQAIVEERIEKLQQLADTYNFHEELLTLRIFGDLKSGIGFTVDCADHATQRAITKTLKMYLNKCPD